MLCYAVLCYTGIADTVQRRSTFHHSPTGPSQRPTLPNSHCTSSRTLSLHASHPRPLSKGHDAAIAHRHGIAQMPGVTERICCCAGRNMHSVLSATLLLAYASLAKVILIGVQSGLPPHSLYVSYTFHLHCITLNFSTISFRPNICVQRFRS